MFSLCLRDFLQVIQFLIHDSSKTYIVNGLEGLNYPHV